MVNTLSMRWANAEYARVALEVCYSSAGTMVICWSYAEDRYNAYDGLPVRIRTFLYFQGHFERMKMS